MTIPKNQIGIYYWTESLEDYRYLKSELRSISHLEVIHAENEGFFDTLQHTKSLIIVDYTLRHYVNQLPMSIPKTQIILTSSQHQAFELGELVFIRLNSLTLLLKSVVRMPDSEEVIALELFNTLIQSVPDLIFFKDLHFNYLTANQAFLDHFKLDKSELIGKKDEDLFPLDIHATSIESDRYVLENARSIKFETNYTDKTNTRRYLETIKTPVFDSNEELIGMVGISRDVTIKKQQESLHQRNSLLLNQSELLTKSGSFELLIDQSRILCSDHLLHMMELDPDDLTSQADLISTIHPADQQNFINTLHQTIETKQKNSIEHRIISSTTNRTIYCRTIMSAELIHKNRMVFGTMVDIGEARTNQQAILNAQENERKTIAADLHDGLIQKLVAANMHLSVLELNQEAQSKLTIASELIRSAIEETRQLTRNLSLRTIDNLGLKNALLETIDSCPLDSEVDYTFDFDEQQINHELSTHIYRIFQEGLANIMKYANATRVNLSLIRDSENLTLNIKDDGVGFDVNGYQNGNGLKNIQQRVSQSNGIFLLDSKPGKGTSLTVVLPTL